MPTAIGELPLDSTNLLQQIVEGGRPRVLRGLCRDWPIVKLARQSDTAFAQGLLAHDNGTPVDALLMPPEAQGLVGYNTAMDGFNYKHFRVTVTQVLQRLAAYSRQDGDTPGLAMQSALIATSLPGLIEAHSIPFFDPSVQPRLWMGNRVTTPAHFDSSHNLAVVACGRRRFTLFPPEQVRNLYVGPLDFAPTAAAISLAPLDAVDDPRYPRLKDALAHAQVAELEPGDAIYIPPVWWHHVESLERLNALVNYWWRPAIVAGHAVEPGLDALMHCILAYRSLPRAERDAWKTLLDHYVFADEDAASHIPAERRGVLGPPTVETLARLRQLAGK
ncbi:cupin-like domain-containing protein [Lysobacter niastensis]|uniref:Cupin-like domain-containing protein n=1 Tax=Lysobacter niastensis TaxID=380629 RepID=A0ABS0BC85_9GAMM|nr:cupin-like domain-containing protein [Lysobacter niastensis]MBF6024599.1 cupin-like domain-containing protein [Lysobacter niastensis]